MSTSAYHFKYQLSDLTLFSWCRRMEVCNFDLDAAEDGIPPELCTEGHGLLLRSVPLPTEVPTVSRVMHRGQTLVRYVLQRYPRYYIDMAGKDFEAYRAKFSAKTRSTLTRRVRKFSEASGDTLHWERFAEPEGLKRFWILARQVSEKTYQEHLLDAGLPNDASYREKAMQWAAGDQLRAFLLFDRELPVSYLFCPIHDGVVQYAYVGYDPAYQRYSVGTVLQWLALESLFQEQRFRYFDFTEGESEHKRLFGTGNLRCANVALLRPTVLHRLLVATHWRFTQGGERVGNWLQRHGLKRRIKRWLRFGGVREADD